MSASTSSCQNGVSLQAAVSSLQEENKLAAQENSRLRAQIADKQLEAEQLDKLIRKLERKIDAVESQRPTTSLRQGFLNREPPKTDAALETIAAPAQVKQDQPKAPKQAFPGSILDGLTGQEVDLVQWQKELEEGDRAGPSDIPRERQLMALMANPVDVNPTFDHHRYGELIAYGKHQEAEAMIRREGGASLQQMQQAPLELLRSSPNFDAAWSDETRGGCSLAQWSAAMGFNEVLAALLAQKADPNHRSMGGVSCLSTACLHNRLDCAKALLGWQADPNEVLGENGETVLMWASRIEYSDDAGKRCANPFVDLLLQHNANVEAVDERNKTALIHASTSGNREAVATLLAVRATIDVQDKDGHTAFQIATKYYNTEVAALLYRSGKVVEAESRDPPEVTSCLDDVGSVVPEEKCPSLCSIV